jgi:hypothetical protein
MDSRKQVGVGRAITFCAWAFGLAWVATAALRYFEPAMAPQQGYDSIRDAMEYRPWFMLCVFVAIVPPAVAMLLARRWKTSVREWGYRVPSGGLIVLLAPLVALAVQLGAIALAVGAGQGEFDASGRAQVQRLTRDRDFRDAIETSYELSEKTNPALRRALLGMLAGLVVGAAAAPIVEIGWRGLLHTELRWTGFAACSLVVGLLAAAWWAPCVVTAPMAGAQTPAAAVRLGALALLGVPLAWLRETTGSIIPAAVFTASWVALLELPLMMVRGASDLQIALMTFAATGLLAGAALLRPPKVFEEAGEKTSET